MKGRDRAFSVKLTALVATAFALCACSTAHASTIEAARGDADRVYFATDESLLAADTDGAVDIYERADGALTLATIGDPSCQPGCGNGDYDVGTAGGLHLIPDGIVFTTAESLLAADTDSAVDIYRRTDAGLELVSQGESFNGAFDVELDAVSENGSVVVFTTSEKVASTDTDSSADIYRRSGSTTTLLSQGEAFNGAFDAKWATSTPDGAATLFRTREKILSEDTDEAIDLYRRKGSTTTWISQGPGGAGNGPFDVGDRVLTSDDGNRTVFITFEKLRDEPFKDEDEQVDIYMRFGNTTSMPSESSYHDPNEGDLPVELDALDPQANQVFMTTANTMNEIDRDHTGLDVYEWFYEKTILESLNELFQPLNPEPRPVEFLRYLPGGLGIVLFSTDERLVSEDTDSSFDIYERINESSDPTKIYTRGEGKTRLVSQGPGGFNGAFIPTLFAAARNGGVRIFTSLERLSKADTDNAVDLYERNSGGGTRLLSAGTINGNGAFDVTPMGDAARPLFTTTEQLVPGDDDTAPDLYERVANHPRLLSSATPDPSAPLITGSNPSSPSNVNDPKLTGSSPADSTVEVFAGAGCSGDAVSTGTAAEFGSGGLTVSAADNATAVFSAKTVNDEGIPGPCSEPFSYLEDSTPGPISLASVAPKGPANDNAPRVRGAAEPDATIHLFAAASCAGPVAGAGSGSELAAGGIAVQVPDNATTPISAVSIDVAGNTSACSNGPSYAEDSKAPDTKILGGPHNLSSDRTPGFRIQLKERGTYPICKLDADPYKRCLIFYRLEKLSFGRHKLTIAAVDQAGNVDPTPAVRKWKVVRAKQLRSIRRHKRRH